MRKPIIVLSLFCLILLFCGCHQNNYEPSVNTEQDISSATDQSIATTDEKHDDLLRQAHDSYTKLDDLYKNNQADFTAVAKALLKLPYSKILIVSGKSGKSVEAVYTNGESVSFTGLFNKDEQKHILTCFEKMMAIAPDNTDIYIRKNDNYGPENVRFEFRIQNIRMDQGLAYCEQNISAITNIYTRL